MNLHQRINLREWFARQERIGTNNFYPGFLVRLPDDELFGATYRAYGRGHGFLAQRPPQPVRRSA